ncbi:MAG: hypothetical protein ACI4PF_05850 [Christensenellales bacterium]
MLELHFENNGNKRSIRFGDKLYKILNDFRGVREKFWIVDNSSQKKSHNLRMLFKFNRNNVSCENWGEVFASTIAHRIDVPCVDYNLAELFDENGKSLGNGVICGTYKRSDKETEFSAYNIQTSYKNYTFDNFRGQQIEGLNTINGFIEALQNTFHGQLSPKELESVRNDLLKQAIFDFLLAQTDRHWLNTTFLLWKEFGRLHVRKAECYDNGCIAMLKRKASAVEGMSREIEAQGENSPLLNLQLSNYCPMMGISTSLVMLDAKGKTGDAEKVRIINPQQGREIFLKELSNEIIHNPEIAVFYKLLETKISSGTLMKNVMKDLDKAGDNPPPYISKLINRVMTKQLSTLDRYVHLAVDEVNKQYEEEYANG